MKLTDFCILFAALFVCLFLGRDLYIRGLLAKSISGISSNRQMDRVSEDALMDIVETAYGDGRLDVRTGQLQEQFERLLALSFDLTDDAAKLHAQEAVTLFCFRQYPYNLSAQEVEGIIAGMEQQANEAKRRRREAQLLRIAMPYRAHEQWYQPPAGPQLLTVFDPREPFAGWERAALSGSRIVKLWRDSGRISGSALQEKGIEAPDNL